MFGNRVKTTEINGKEFQIHLLRASDGVTIAQKLSTIVATFLETDDKGEVDLDFSKIAKAVTSSLTDKELLEILSKLLKGMAVDGKEISFDEYFSGNYGELIKILSFTLQENFGSFFEGMVIPD